MLRFICKQGPPHTRRPAQHTSAELRGARAHQPILVAMRPRPLACPGRARCANARFGNESAWRGARRNVCVATRATPRASGFIAHFVYYLGTLAARADQCTKALGDATHTNNKFCRASGGSTRMEATMGLSTDAWFKAPGRPTPIKSDAPLTT